MLLMNETLLLWNILLLSFVSVFLFYRELWFSRTFASRFWRDPLFFWLPLPIASLRIFTNFGHNILFGVLCALFHLTYSLLN
uniref:Uncharacterized protein n=1 Tax=Anopheles aquasalis TaxID=42839 RepID=T1DP77_ANOAQ